MVGALDSSWHHVAFTYTAGSAPTLAAVLDGRTQESRATTLPADTSNAGLAIGSDGMTTTLDEVALYDRALGADQLAEHYQAAQSGSYAQNHSYDEADRLTDPGYTYDPLGRTTTVPSRDAGGQGTLTAGSRGALTASYYSTDLVRSLTQNGATTTYTLDPLRRTRTTTTSGQNATTTQHYPDSTAAGSEAASWIETPGATTAWTRSIPGPDGMLAATQTSTGTVRLVLTDLHGSIVGTTDDAPYATPYPPNSESTEYGGATPSTTPTPRADVGPDHYSWLGGHQRNQDAPGDLTLMGQRLYNPTTGRFLQTDPVPGGSANNYDYANQDPLNDLDLDGRCSWYNAYCHVVQPVARHTAGFASKVSSVAGYIPFCEVCATVSLATGIYATLAYTSSGDYTRARRQLVSTAANATLGSSGGRIHRELPVLQSAGQRVVARGGELATSGVSTAVGATQCGISPGCGAAGGQPTPRSISRGTRTFAE